MWRDSKVKGGVERAKEEAVTKPVQSVRLTDGAMNAARIKGACFEKAVEALGDYDDPELAGLKHALSQAKASARSWASTSRFRNAGRSSSAAIRRTQAQNDGCGRRHESLPIHKKLCDKASSRRGWSLRWSEVRQ